MKDYQRQRIMTFLDPASDPYGSGYNVTQSLITVGSGGMWGRGFGHGPQSQFNFLPVAHTDFVFAGIAEATGFVGSVVLLVLFAIFFLRIVSLSKLSRDNFGSIFALSIAAIILAQFIINVGMNIGLMPVTGITLPFISYGGSSLIIMLACVGILQSIYIRHKKINFK
jgi:rod shape determining protein RodA